MDSKGIGIFRSYYFSVFLSLFENPRNRVRIMCKGDLKTFPELIKYVIKNYPPHMTFLEFRTRDECWLAVSSTGKMKFP